MSISITLIGGPTALIEIDGFRLLTDPTFDAPGPYQLPHVTLEKTVGPALKADAIGPVDAVLLSHDQHSDNLDNSGRAPLQMRRGSAVRRRRQDPRAVPPHHGHQRHHRARAHRRLEAFSPEQRGPAQDV